ncbi:hypothetical protein QS257_12250 [Terrilactibacillus sp. S3-3]|nr:hypothetical protein QS257_12250 [Terrilactibacillus sp. S3-3]
MSKQWLADLSLLFIAVVWGSSYLATKVVLTDMRFSVSFSPLFDDGCYDGDVDVEKKLVKASKETWLSGVTFGLFLAGIFTSETWGIHGTTAANAGFLISLFVVFTPLVESLMFKKNA